MSIIFMITTLLWVISFATSLIYSTLKDEKHKALCEEFKERFGYYPEDIAAYERGGILFTFQKDIFFMMALSFKEKSFFIRNINKDLYNFIREQPESKTSWIKIKFLLFLFSVLILVTDCVIYSLFIEKT